MFLLNYFSHTIRDNVGFSIIAAIGNKCKKANKCSREKDEDIFTKIFDGVPCWEI